MERAEREIHTGLTLSEVDRVNDDINYVQEVLTLVLLVNQDEYVGGPPSTDAIIGEAIDRMKRIDETINHRNREE